MTGSREWQVMHRDGVTYLTDGKSEYAGDNNDGDLHYVANILNAKQQELDRLRQRAALADEAAYFVEMYDPVGTASDRKGIEARAAEQHDWLARYEALQQQGGQS